MLILTILHNIFLTSEERHKLANGNSVETTGISVPTWFSKGNTSEPSSEVFCKYILTNQLEDYPVTTLVQGYKINIPQVPSGHHLIKRPSKSEWEEMTNSEKENWERSFPMPPNGFDLLNQEEGGKSSIKFKRYNKIRSEKKNMNIIHAININDINLLEETICI